MRAEDFHTSRAETFCLVPLDSIGSLWLQRLFSPEELKRFVLCHLTQLDSFGNADMLIPFILFESRFMRRCVVATPVPDSIKTIKYYFTSNFRMHV